MADFATKADVAAVSAQLAVLQQRLHPLAFTARPQDVRPDDFHVVATNNANVSADVGTFNQIQGALWWFRVGNLINFTMEMDIISVGSASGLGPPSADRIYLDFQNGSTNPNDGLALVPWAEVINYTACPGMMYNFSGSPVNQNFDLMSVYMPTFPLMTIQAPSNAPRSIFASGNSFVVSGTYIAFFQAFDNG